MCHSGPRPWEALHVTTCSPATSPLKKVYSGQPIGSMGRGQTCCTEPSCTVKPKLDQLTPSQYYSHEQSQPRSAETTSLIRWTMQTHVYYCMLLRFCGCLLCSNVFGNSKQCPKDCKEWGRDEHGLCQPPKPYIKECDQLSGPGSILTQAI